MQTTLKTGKLYIRQLRELNLSGISLGEKGMKTYNDPQSGKSLPYVSGQQIKHCFRNRFFEAYAEKYGEVLPPTMLEFLVKKPDEGGFRQGQVLNLTDPRYPDQLFGGYMRTETTVVENSAKGRKGKKEKANVKRKSPLAFSCMYPVSVQAVTKSTEAFPFDRTSEASFHKVKLDDAVKMRTHYILC